MYINKFKKNNKINKYIQKRQLCKKENSNL